MHVCVALQHHHLIDFDTAGFAHAAKIIALQINQHDMFRPLLWVRKQLAGQVIVRVRVGGSRSRTGNGPRRRDALAYLEQAFR